MNIYKKENEILVSENGRPKGWTYLGYDETLNDKNKKYVSGFDKYTNQAIFDSDKQDQDLNNFKQSLFNQVLTLLEDRINNYIGEITYKGKPYHSSFKSHSRISIVKSYAERNGNATYPDKNFQFDHLTFEELEEIQNLINDDIYLEGIRLYGVLSLKLFEISNLTLDNINEYNFRNGWD